MITPLINPVSLRCNLRCGYCFHRNKPNHLQQKPFAVMKIELIESIIENLLQSYPNEQKIEITWHGGEPMLAGKEFFKNVLQVQDELSKKYNKQISNNLQTNGTLIDKEWLDILEHPSFGIGISLDGPKEIHDILRRTVHHEGTFDRIQQAILSLRERGIHVSVVSVITKYHLGKVQEYFDFFANSGIEYIKINPCFEFTHLTDSYESFSLQPGDFFIFGKELFDIWLNSGITTIKFGYLDDIIRTLVKGEASTCLLSDGCKNFVVIEPNGNLHPCDDLFGENYLLGNICHTTFGELTSNQESVYNTFYAKIETSRNDCKSCDWFAFCKKGCPYLWNYRGQGEYLLCEDNKQLLSYVVNRIASL